MSSIASSTLTSVATSTSHHTQPPSPNAASSSLASACLTLASASVTPNVPPSFTPTSPSPSSGATAQATQASCESLIPSSPTPNSITGSPQHQPQRVWQNLIRSDFWFADGNIVLIAGNAIFKVHRGQLERQSEIFRDLFSIPQPRLQRPHIHGRQGARQHQRQVPRKQGDSERSLSEDGDQDDEEGLIDGCPWVELHDRPADVFYFLAALYDGLYFKSPRTSDFAAVSAVLRLSTKYLVETLRLRCLARLELDWPTTLAGWDTRERSALDSQGRYLPREVCCHPILLMELAFSTELGLSHLLPAAFYDLSRYGPSKIMAGTVNESVALDVASSADPVSESRERCVVLNRDMLARTFKGREKAQKYISDFVARELENRSPASDCAGRIGQSGSNGGGSSSSGTPDGQSVGPRREGKDKEPSRSCLESFYFIMLNILRSVGGIACGRDADPLFTLVQATEMLSRTDFSDGQRTTGLKICHACKVDFAASVAKAREEVWSLLPVWFGLVSPSEKGGDNSTGSSTGGRGASDAVSGVITS